MSAEEDTVEIERLRAEVERLSTQRDDFQREAQHHANMSRERRDEVERLREALLAALRTVSTKWYPETVKLIDDALGETEAE